jgi:peptide deformylase
MILPVLNYGHPVLRKKGQKIEALTPELHELIVNMKETMYEARGVGLAAQQVGRALQLAIVDVSEVTDRPSTLFWEGQPVPVEDYMPLVLINPEITPLTDPASGPEGCLSFPEIYADISRPESIEVTAMNERWERVRFRCGGLLARAIQHEADHLNGILFIDRMVPSKKRELQPELDQLQAETKETLQKTRLV